MSKQSQPVRTQEKAWIAEYEQEKGIESSFTMKPERCVLWFSKLLAARGKTSGKLLDVGCGCGRNSYPFLKKQWSVTGQDIVPVALQRYTKYVGQKKYKLKTICNSLKKPLPYKTSAFDAVMEITVADNLVEARHQKQFWSGVANVLKPGGLVLSYYFTPADGYYGPLLKRSNLKKGLVYDKRAGMYFKYYSAADITRCSQGRLQLLEARHYSYMGPMFGKQYKRDLVASVFLNVSPKEALPCG